MILAIRVLSVPKGGQTCLIDLQGTDMHVLVQPHTPASTHVRMSVSRLTLWPPEMLLAVCLSAEYQRFSVGGGTTNFASYCCCLRRDRTSDYLRWPARQPV